MVAKVKLKNKASDGMLNEVRSIESKSIVVEIEEIKPRIILNDDEFISINIRLQKYRFMWQINFCTRLVKFLPLMPYI